MFEIDHADLEKMFEETQSNLRKIEGIEEVIELQRFLYKTDNPWICFGDDQICGLALSADHKTLTVYIESSKEYNVEWNGKLIDKAFYAIDFYEPEIVYFDIQYNTHWIDEICIQQNEDGKYSVSFGSGELDFRYSKAKVNRCWCE